MSESSLSADFYRAWQRHQAALAKTPPKAEQDSLLLLLKTLAHRVELSSIYADNEELDDLATEDIKYLLLPAWVGDISQMESDMSKRKNSLSRAIVSWQVFLSRAGRYNLIDAEDQDQVFQDPDEEGPKKPDAGLARMEKISRFKRDQDLETKINYYFEKVLKEAQKCQKDEDFDEERMWSCGGMINEEDVRSVMAQMIKRQVLKCIEEIASAKREMPMLEMMAASKGGFDNDKRERLDYDKENEKPRKPWQISIKDPLELKRIFQEQVFQPDVSMPTVTLAEYADSEMEKIREQESKKQESVVSEWRVKNESLDNLGHLEGKREREEQEKEDKKKRDWDDWTDFNQKGIGNKQTNRA